MLKSVRWLGLACVCAAGVASAGEIPDWAEKEIQKTFVRFRVWKGDDTVVAVPFLTDKHSFTSGIDTSDNFADSKRHVRILKRAAEVFDADATADLGDLGFDCEGVYTTPSSAAHQAARIASEQQLYADFTRTHFALVGNHDHGAATNKITNAQFGEYFNAASYARTAGIVTGPNRDYGYYDVPGKNARLFFLNTTETVTGNGYGISDDQVAFLRTHLAELNNGATAFVFTHYCLHQRLGRWDEAGWTPSDITNLDATVQVLEKFAARSDVHLAGVMAGDSHFDNQITTNGVNWSISQGFGGCSASCLPADPAQAVTTSFTRSSQTLVDVVAFKPATGEYRVFRIGAGGIVRDRHFLSLASGDTFTWTGAGDGLRWSVAANWSTDSTTHTVPASGDRVIVTGIQNGAVISNDIAGLSLPYLEIGGDASSSPSFRLYGQAITLTGGWNGFVSRSGRYYNYIPFVLPRDGANPVVRFNFSTASGGSGGRMDQRSDISGPGRLHIYCANYYTPSVDMSYTGGTVCEKGTVDPSTSFCLGAAAGGPVEVHGTQFRFYNMSYIGNSYDEVDAYSSSDTKHTYQFWNSAKTSESFTGRRFAAYWGSGSKTFSGPITVDRLSVFTDLNAAGNAVHFNGRVTTKTVNAGFDGRTDKFYTNTITFAFNAADNALGDLYLNRNKYVMGAVNALGTNTVIHPGEQSTTVGTVDCCGYDQRIDRIVLNANHPISAERPEGHVITSSTGPATLTLAATADCETDAIFSGELSLVWAPKDAYTFSTYAAYGREMSMSGALIVSNGIFEINGANTFPHVTRIEVAPGATLRIGEGVTLPFRETLSSEGCVLDLAETASLILPAGSSFPVTEVRTNGVTLAGGTVYTGDAEATDAVYLPQIIGNGRVSATTVPSSPSTDVSPLSARAYVQEGLTGLLDGYENAGWGAHDGSAMTWKDLVGEIGDFTVSNSVGQFTSTGLKKIKGGTLAWCASCFNKLPDDVRTIETSVSDVTADIDHVMPVWIKSTQYINFRRGGSSTEIIGFDNKHLGCQYPWPNGVREASRTVTAFYTPLSQATGFRINGGIPADGVSVTTENFSDGSYVPTLGGRWISWAGNDTAPFGYTINAVRFYSRELTDAEVTNNWVVDSFRFRGTVPVDTPDYRGSSDRSRIYCRVTVKGNTGLHVALGTHTAALEDEMWVAAGDFVTLRAISVNEATAFASWVGDTNAFAVGTATDRAVTLRVDRALTFATVRVSTLLVVSQDTTLATTRPCSGIRFTGPYTLSGEPVEIDEASQGICVDDGVTGTAKITCPLTIGSFGAAQPLTVPATATLEITSAVSGNAALTAAAGGNIKFLGGGSIAGDWDFTEGRVDLTGVFTDTTGSLRVSTNAPLYLANADLAKLLKCNYYNGKKVMSVANTTNVLRGGWAQIQQGKTPTWNFDTGANSELTFYGIFNSGKGGNYPTFAGSGTVHTRTTSDTVGSLSVNSSVKWHVWEKMFASRPNYNALSSGSRVYLHAENAFSYAPTKVFGYLDLCGTNQTMGRFSYVSEWNADGSPKSFTTTGEIHSDEPATLTVRHDTNASGGGNSGLQIFGGIFSGRVSLVRSCDPASSYAAKVAANPLYLAGVNTATGTVFATYGLLGFTNYVYQGKSYAGRWPHCTEAGARENGTLELTESGTFGRNVKIRVGAGGKVRLAARVRQIVDGVYFGDETVSRPYGTYGSSQSRAQYKDDEHFEGEGVVCYPNPGSVLLFR